MVDFKKIMAMTPEERAQRREQADMERKEQDSRTIMQRSGWLKTALANKSRLTEWERNFIEDIAKQASGKDPILGCIGGSLVFLSSKQEEILQRIAEKVS